MENSTAQEVDNGTAQTQDAGTTTTQTQTAPVAAPTTSTGWKSGIRADLKNSPLLQKFEDSPAGLEKALESYGNLEKLLGNEKVPIPKDDKDAEGWARFSKAMGIPEKADGYGLEDPKLPDSLKGMTIDKAKFAEVVHANKLTPGQAKGLWKVYNDMQVESYNKYLGDLQTQLDKTVNSLKQEWGDAYQANVELGQNVINQFADTPEAKDYVTATMLKDPNGIKFLAKIGEQFAENKIGNFQGPRFSMTTDQAQIEIEKMTKDMEGPYMNLSGKFTEKEHQAAVERMNTLRSSVQKAKGQG